MRAGRRVLECEMNDSGRRSRDRISASASPPEGRGGKTSFGARCEREPGISKSSGLAGTIRNDGKNSAARINVITRGRVDGDLSPRHRAVGLPMRPPPERPTRSRSIDRNRGDFAQRFDGFLAMKREVAADIESATRRHVDDVRRGATWRAVEGDAQIRPS